MDSAHHIEALLHQLELKETADARLQLTEAVRHLLLYDFSKLVYILYRVDVNEKRLKQLLQEHPQADAAVVITDELIHRQLQKKHLRDSFRSNTDIPDEERW